MRITTPSAAPLGRCPAHREWTGHAAPISRTLRRNLSGTIQLKWERGRLARSFRRPAENSHTSNLRTISERSPTVQTHRQDADGSDRDGRAPLFHLNRFGFANHPSKAQDNLLAGFQSGTDVPACYCAASAIHKRSLFMSAVTVREAANSTTARSNVSRGMTCMAWCRPAALKGSVMIVAPAAVMALCAK